MRVDAAVLSWRPKGAGKAMTKQLETDEELAAVRVGGTIAPHNATVHLVPYDPTWPAQYAAEEAKIRAALGDAALVLEHVGSTSIPGISAKPILDILLAVSDSADEDAYVPALTAQGYRLHIREPDWEQHRLMKGDNPLVNLHVFTVGSKEISRMLGFRDRCRNHPEERRLYEETKRDLAARTWRYVQHYANAKGEVVEAIIARALKGGAE
ncbi:GrpB family protein [Polyangium sp. 15x6]|uniref:GrpB family protein n=1 Tax=Polyangium sp. 15x6 TaxID=3042687 RepID=UPI00249AD0D9|nr:GrpB family protein [Polyangium sp. 15x6]MDI3288700.1 GrpB family protein [Polyangium sp. 15x6]